MAARIAKIARTTDNSISVKPREYLMVVSSCDAACPQIGSFFDPLFLKNPRIEGAPRAKIAPSRVWSRMFARRVPSALGRSTLIFLVFS